MQERKKNKYDPIAHPVRFFRKDENDVEGINMDHLKNHIEKNLRTSKPLEKSDFP